MTDNEAAALMIAKLTGKAITYVYYKLDGKVEEIIVAGGDVTVKIPRGAQAWYTWDRYSPVPSPLPGHNGRCWEARTPLLNGNGEFVNFVYE